MKKVTLFITSCGRPDLLKRTLETFNQFNTYPIEEAIIVEDSGIVGSIDFVHEICSLFPCKVIYNEKRLGQMASMELGVKYIKTPYTFHCEDDWEFYDYSFIEASMEILESNENISMVFLRSYAEYIFRYNMQIDESMNYKYNVLHQNNNSLYSFNPGLRRTNIYFEKYPYTTTNEDEGTLQSFYRTKGYISVVTKNHAGYVDHIGWGRHIQ